MNLSSSMVVGARNWRKICQTTLVSYGISEACAVPLLLAGPAADIHAEELRPVHGLHLAADPLLAEQRLRELGLLEGPPCAS